MRVRDGFECGKGIIHPHLHLHPHSHPQQSEKAILLLKTAVKDLLMAFQDNSKGALPEHVVCYRDGLDDVQFERVQDEEVAALRVWVRVWV